MSANPEYVAARQRAFTDALTSRGEVEITDVADCRVWTIKSGKAAARYACTGPWAPTDEQIASIVRSLQMVDARAFRDPAIKNHRRTNPIRLIATRIEP